MGTFLKIALALVVLIVLFCAGLMFLAPGDYEVSREVTIAAPPAQIHPLVEDLHRWPEWSFWNEEYDPTMTYTYSGPDKGVGAVSAWEGKDGPGRMEITSSDPEKGVWFDMAFGEPGAEMEAKSVLLYEPTAGGTKVTMSIRGGFPGPMKPLNWAADAMMGPAFEETLAGLKEAAESAPAAEAEAAVEEAAEGSE